MDWERVEKGAKYTVLTFAALELLVSWGMGVPMVPAIVFSILAVFAVALVTGIVELTHGGEPAGAVKPATKARHAPSPRVSKVKPAISRPQKRGGHMRECQQCGQEMEKVGRIDETDLWTCTNPDCDYARVAMCYARVTERKEGRA